MQRWHFALVPFILQSRMLERKESYGGNVDLCTNFAYCGHSQETARLLTLQRYVIQSALFLRTAQLHQLTPAVGLPGCAYRLNENHVSEFDVLFVQQR